MSYDQEQKAKQIAFFGAEKGGGTFGNKVYDFVFQERYCLENLYPPLAADMLNYFKQTPIKWWRGVEGGPTNLMIATQIACLNHLYWLNDNPEAATAFLKRLDSDWQAVPFASGRLVEFEYNGVSEREPSHLLGEKSAQRGVDSTGFSAAFLAETKSGSRELVAIEWRYCEKYYQKAAVMDDDDPLYVSRRAKLEALLTRADCPVFLERGKEQQEANYETAFQKFSVEPFYTTLLETLLAWQMVEHHVEQVSGWRYLQVIPDGNILLRKGETSRAITDGYADIAAGWQSYLREPHRYACVDSRKLVEPLAQQFAPETADYLRKRYWQ